MRTALIAAAIILAAVTAMACDAPGSPDPWGLSRPAEWDMSFTYYNSSGQPVANVVKHVCRGNPSTTGIASDIVYWFAEYTLTATPEDVASTEAYFQTNASHPYGFPPEKRIYPRRRAA